MNADSAFPLSENGACVSGVAQYSTQSDLVVRMSVFEDAKMNVGGAENFDVQELIAGQALRQIVYFTSLSGNRTITDVI